MPVPTVSFRPDVLAGARQAKGWTLRDVSDRTAELGKRVDFSNLSKYERGDVTRAQRRTLTLLAQALEVDEDDLIGAAA